MDPKSAVIFSDMDGTLLTTWDLGPVVPNSNLIAIKKWLDLGGLFSVATGRNLKNVPQYFTNFSIDVPMVLLNGSLLYSQKYDKILYEEKLSQLFLADSIDFYLCHEYVSLVLSDEKEVYAVIHEDSKIKPFIDFPHHPITIKDIEKINVLKVSFVVTDEFAELANKEIRKITSINLGNVLPSAKRFIEVVSNKSTKAIGIKKAIELANINHRILICIGDYTNDIEMLEIADIKAAPINGHENVKKYASIITKSNNEGAISDLIEQLLKL